VSTSEPTSNLEHVEEELSLAGEVAAEGVRAIELGVFALGALVFVPPLAILVFIVTVPTLVCVAALSLVASPFLLVRHLRRRGS
jgi:hypothetical protein